MKSNFFRGITFIEVLIAAGVLSLLLGSAATVSHVTSRSEILKQNYDQATAIADEAMEIIKNLRDSTYIDEKFNSPFDYIDSRCLGDNKCFENVELIWQTDSNSWILEKDSSAGEDSIAGQEIISVDLTNGQIIDNAYRIKDTSNTFPIMTCDNPNITEGMVNKIVFCRKISLVPTVSLGDINNTVLPNIADRDVKIGRDITEDEKQQYIYDLLSKNGRRVIIEVSWWDFGKQQTVQMSDLLTNWRWLD